ncbi:MAG: hypothetical protein V7767_12930 [Leeuwenhoekiella sp.]
MKNIKFILPVFLFALSFLGNAQTEKAELIYVMDPQCSWCYANSGNIEEIEKALDGKMDIHLKVGGMWIGDEAPQGGQSYFESITNHLPGMLARTGANIGTGYYDLASDPSYTFSSVEPGAAIVLVNEMDPKKTITFAREVESALFKDGKRLDKLETYTAILKKLDISTEDFAKNWLTKENLAKTSATFKEAKIAKTFPSLILKQGDKIEVLSKGFFTKDEILPKLKTLIAQ